MQPATVDDIPAEIWHIIFAFIPIIDLCRLAQVARFYLQQLLQHRPYELFTIERKKYGDVRAAYFIYVTNRDRVNGDQMGPPKELALAEQCRGYAYRNLLDLQKLYNISRPVVRIFAIHGAARGQHEVLLRALLSMDHRVLLTIRHTMFEAARELLCEVFADLVKYPEIVNFVGKCRPELLDEAWGVLIAQHHGIAGITAFLNSMSDGQVALRLYQKITDPLQLAHIRQFHLRKYDLAYANCRGIAEFPFHETDVYAALITWARNYPEDTQTLQYILRVSSPIQALDLRYFLRVLLFGWKDAAEALLQHVPMFNYTQPFSSVAEPIIENRHFQQALLKLQPDRAFPSDSRLIALHADDDIIQKMDNNGNLRHILAVKRRLPHPLESTPAKRVRRAKK